MNYRILLPDNHPTLLYAEEELSRVLTAMDGTLTRGENGYAFTFKVLPPKDGKEEIDVSLEKGVGVIAGEGALGVLIAVYRLLTHLGCRWTLPGKAGEHIPKKTLTPEDLTLSFREIPSYRHRGVCIEGACSEENVVDMLEFLPRVGMNSYFIQFHKPKTFFERYYAHEGNTLLPKEEFTDERLTDILTRVESKISRLSLHYQAIGHGWTCEPFGVKGGGWYTQKDEDMPKGYIPLTAMVNGKRGLWKGVSLNTNLCYSQEKARDTVTDGILSYCREHPQVETVHFWLADAYNNCCECDDCRKMRPADWYVQMLNELDEKLTAANVKTRVVFLVYCDLLWAPEKNKIKNPDRFILMFAPISRSYTESMLESREKGGSEPSPFLLNKLTLPTSVYTNVRMLEDWQKDFAGDSFVFDYHLMWAHGWDIGYEAIAKLLFDDMKHLSDFGLNGMISCQLSRVGFPTGLPLYAMAKALWNKDADYNDVWREYYDAEFGKGGESVHEYLHSLSELTNQKYMHREMPEISEEQVLSCMQAKATIFAYRMCHSEMRIDSPVEAWKTLAYHATFAELLLEIVIRRARGEKRDDLKIAFRNFVSAIEPEVQKRLDLWNANATLIDLL